MRLFSRAIAFTLSAASILPSVSAIAVPREPDYPCYLRTSSGKVIDLTATFCKTPVTVTNQTASRAKQPPKPLTADEKLSFRAVYSDAYCEARKQGQTDRQAGSSASSAIANAAVQIVGVDRLDDVLADKSVFAEAVARKAVLCPQYAND